LIKVRAKPIFRYEAKTGMSASAARRAALTRPGHREIPLRHEDRKNVEENCWP
jgi:hypothetical protein